MKLRRFAFCTMAGALLAGLTMPIVVAQTPKLVNAKLENRAAATDFPAQIAGIVHSAQTAEWIGYSVRATEGDHQMCCGTYYDDHMVSCGVCQLENDRYGRMSSRTGSDCRRAARRWRRY